MAFWCSCMILSGFFYPLPYCYKRKKNNNIPILQKGGWWDGGGVYDSTLQSIAEPQSQSPRFNPGLFSNSFLCWRPLGMINTFVLQNHVVWIHNGVSGSGVGFNICVWTFCMWGKTINKSPLNTGGCDEIRPSKGRLISGGVSWECVVDVSCRDVSLLSNVMQPDGTSLVEPEEIKTYIWKTQQQCVFP